MRYGQEDNETSVAMYHPLSGTFARCVRNVYDVNSRQQVPHISTTTWSIKQEYLDTNNTGKLVSKLVGKVFPQINGGGKLISNPDNSDKGLTVLEVWTVKSNDN